MILSKILTLPALVSFCGEGRKDDDDDATVTAAAAAAAGCPQPLHQSLCTT